MMKKIIYYILCFASVNLVLSQELFIQDSDELSGSEKVQGQKYVTVYDNNSHFYRYFDELGNEIFLIKSFNEKGDQIALSIEKNKETDAMEIIIENTPVAVLVNSIIYNFEMMEIGRLFRGEYVKKNIQDFWSSVDYRYGNISIYDHTGLYKVGSFYFKQDVDYYSVLGVDKVDNVADLDARTLKKHIRNIQKYYKKLVRKYDLKRNPDNEELHEEFANISNAYIEVMRDLCVE